MYPNVTESGSVGENTFGFFVAKTYRKSIVTDTGTPLFSLGNGCKNKRVCLMSQLEFGEFSDASAQSSKDS